MVTAAILVQMGVAAILSSGQRETAEEGLPLLKAVQEAFPEVEVMAGGGIGAANASVFKAAQLKAVHLSATAFATPVDLAGKLTMNSQKHLAEHQVAVSQEEVVRAVVAHVK